MKKYIAVILLGMLINCSFVKAEYSLEELKCYSPCFQSCSLSGSSEKECDEMCIGQCNINKEPDYEYPDINNIENLDRSCYASCEMNCSKVEGNSVDYCGNFCVNKCIKIDKDESKLYKVISCGDTEIPYFAAKLVHKIINILKIVTPIIIIILGSVDLLKAVMAQKEDEIKKGQQTFFKRLITGASVFLVFAVVQMIIGLVAPSSENASMWNCVECFVNGECSNIIK